MCDPRTLLAMKPVRDGVRSFWARCAANYVPQCDSHKQQDVQWFKVQSEKKFGCTGPLLQNTAENGSLLSVSNVAERRNAYKECLRAIDCRRSETSMFAQRKAITIINSILCFKYNVCAPVVKLVNQKWERKNNAVCNSRSCLINTCKFCWRLDDKKDPGWSKLTRHAARVDGSLQ